MLKRIVLTTMFVVAFGVAGMSLTNNADAQWRWNGPYTSYYYGTPAYDYGYYSPYRYRSYYAPQTYFYARPAYTYAPRPYYDSYYYRPSYYGPVPQVAFRNGMLR